MSNGFNNNLYKITFFDLLKKIFSINIFNQLINEYILQIQFSNRNYQCLQVICEMSLTYTDYFLRKMRKIHHLKFQLTIILIIEFTMK